MIIDDIKNSHFVVISFEYKPHYTVKLSLKITEYIIMHDVLLV